jgi:hypothetical protein
MVPHRTIGSATLDGVERSSFDVLAELFAKDVDRELLRQSLSKTPTERIQWLEEMQAFADLAKKARQDEASRTPQVSR